MARYGSDYGRSTRGGPDFGRRPYYGGELGRGGYDYGYRTGGGWDRDRFRTGGAGLRYGYDHDRDRYRAGGPYDREYKSRWQTDYGDPFGDRARGTPIRTMRGEFENRDEWNRRRDYDRGFLRGRYDRDWW